jgi:hypothetical protein
MDSAVVETLYLDWIEFSPCVRCGFLGREYSKRSVGILGGSGRDMMFVIGPAR